MNGASTKQEVGAVVVQGSSVRHLNLSSRLRRPTGYNLAEVGPTLWIVLLILGFPLLAFGTLGLRYMFLFNAARLAATAGSVCNSYSANVSSTNVSSVNTATTVANQSAAGFKGITLTQITCNIVTIPITGTSATRQSTPLTTPADSTNNNYAFEVVLTGNLTPLVASPKGFFGTIPGLTAPMSVNARYDVMFENTNHLNM